MKGIVLAGGTGSRLLPLTKVTNKHLLPVGRKPMIYYPIEKLVEAGIQDILIVTGTDHMGDIVRTLGSGRDFGCEFTYRVQDRAGGIAEALGLARGFAAGGPVAVILGDNIFEDPLGEGLRDVERCLVGHHLYLKKVPDPRRFGVAELRGGRIVGIEEKPAHPKSNLAVAGIYVYSASVFDLIAGLRPSARGELEITDVNQAIVAKGDLSHTILDGWWSDAGTFESLARAAELVQGEGEPAGR